MEILKTLSIDLSGKQNVPVVYAVQGEKNSRKIRFDLFNGGVQWEIDRNASILISYKKPDGHGGMYDVLDSGESAFEFVENSTNSVIITLAKQVLTTVGNVPLIVSFMVGDKILSTFSITLDVSENPGIDVAESEDYFSLSAAIDAAKKVVGEMLDPNAFASKEYVDGVIGDLREDLDEIADDARVFYVTISKSDDGSFVADKSVAVISSAYDNGRTVKAVVDDDGEQVTIPLIGIIEGDTVMYVGYGANSNRIIISQTDVLVSIHNDALPNVKTVNGIAPDENGNVTVSSGGADGITPHIGENGNWFIGETDTGMPSRGEDAPQEAILYTPQSLTPEKQAQTRANIGAVAAPETATAGQTIVVKEVDENGKPTQWRAADLPTGGGSGWKVVAETATTERVNSISLDISNIPELQVGMGMRITVYVPPMPSGEVSSGGNATLLIDYAQLANVCVMTNEYNYATIHVEGIIITSNFGNKHGPLLHGFNSYRSATGAGGIVNGGCSMPSTNPQLCKLENAGTAFPIGTTVRVEYCEAAEVAE